MWKRACRCPLTAGMAAPPSPLPAGSPGGPHSYAEAGHEFARAAVPLAICWQQPLCAWPCSHPSFKLLNFVAWSIVIVATCKHGQQGRPLWGEAGTAPCRTQPVPAGSEGRSPGDTWEAGPRFGKGTRLACLRGCARLWVGQSVGFRETVCSAVELQELERFNCGVTA